MGTEKQRKKNLQGLKNAFIEADRKGLGIEKTKLIASVCLDYGITERKIREYLKILFDTGFIEEDEFGLWLKDKSYINQEIAEADATLRANNGN